MTVFARLRSSSRGILVWMLLAAYMCTPLAAWAQPREQAVVVPYCTGQTPGKAGTSGPLRIVLRFAGHAQVAASAVQFALPATARHTFDRLETAGFETTPRREPVAAPPLGWHPPPRAPPASHVQV
jgi:hypothetical protein